MVYCKLEAGDQYGYIFAFTMKYIGEGRVWGEVQNTKMKCTTGKYLSSFKTSTHFRNYNKCHR